MSPSQFCRSLQKLKWIVLLKLLQAARVKGRVRKSHLRQKHLLSLLWVIVILEHLVEHEVQQLLVRYEKLNEFLSFDLRELFNLLWRSRFDNPQVGLQ